MRESVRILRFAIVGTLNALITALIVGLLMHIEGEHYMIANVVAYVVAQIHNFIWCKFWIFPFDADRKKNTIWHEILFFACAFAVAYAAQFLFLLFLQRIFSIPTDTLLIVFLKYSQELRNFCGFDVVPDGSKFTHFKQDFLADLQSMLPGTCLPLNKILMPAGRERSYPLFLLMAEYSIHPVCFGL